MTIAPDPPADPDDIPEVPEPQIVPSGEPAPPPGVPGQDPGATPQQDPDGPR